MRGIRKLYSPYFKENEKCQNGKGRSSLLIEKRDRKLVLRYYFYTEVRRLNFTQTIEQLTLEFDIAERTITDRLQKYNDTITEIMKNKPAIVELKKEYPYLSWQKN